jgi:hypothetical protein
LKRETDGRRKRQLAKLAKLNAKREQTVVYDGQRFKRLLVGVPSESGKWPVRSVIWISKCTVCGRRYGFVRNANDAEMKLTRTCEEHRGEGAHKRPVRQAIDADGRPLRSHRRRGGSRRAVDQDARAAEQAIAAQAELDRLYARVAEARARRTPPEPQPPPRINPFD